MRIKGESKRAQAKFLRHIVSAREANGVFYRGIVAVVGGEETNRGDTRR